MKDWKRKKSALVLGLCFALVCGLSLHGCGKEKADTAESEALTEETMTFVDVDGTQHTMTIDADAVRHAYDLTDFIAYGDWMSYQGDSAYTYRLGVDVSYHQGDIDWQSVADAGISFAFLRIGFRGYGEEGTLNIDEKFEENYAGATAAGIDVGVYFFAQAVNEEEAIEEAKTVIAWLNERDLDLPVVYDPETIYGEQSRTSDVSGQQFTANTIAFCDTILSAGYEVAIYANMLWEAYELDMGQLKDYTFWYADYEAAPQTPYEFTYWQYTETATVDGISTEVDLNIELIPTAATE